MISKRSLVAVALAFAIGSAMPAFPQGSEHEAWRQMARIDAFVEKAAAQGKTALVFLTSRTCLPCGLLEREFFTDPKVARALGAKFMMIEVNGDAGIEGIYRKYGLAPGYPTFFSLGPDGKVLGRLPGAEVEQTPQGMAIDKPAMLAALLRLAPKPAEGEGR